MGSSLTSRLRSSRLVLQLRLLLWWWLFSLDITGRLRLWGLILCVIMLVLLDRFNLCIIMLPLLMLLVLHSLKVSIVMLLLLLLLGGLLLSIIMLQATARLLKLCIISW